MRLRAITSTRSRKLFIIASLLTNPTTFKVWPLSCQTHHLGSGSLVKHSSFVREKASELNTWGQPVMIAKIPSLPRLGCQLHLESEEFGTRSRGFVQRQLLRSSLVDIEIRGEPWKARASESKGSVQARAAGITFSGADRVGPTRLRPVARAWKASSLVLKAKCLHTYELLKRNNAEE